MSTFTTIQGMLLLTLPPSSSEPNSQATLTETTTLPLLRHLCPHSSASTVSFLHPGFLPAHFSATTDPQRHHHHRCPFFRFPPSSSSSSSFFFSFSAPSLFLITPTARAALCPCFLTHPASPLLLASLPFFFFQFTDPILLLLHHITTIILITTSPPSSYKALPPPLPPPHPQRNFSPHPINSNHSRNSASSQSPRGFDDAERPRHRYHRESGPDSWDRSRRYEAYI
ncbi:hypothetical protein M0R45_003117 [Rubus argutus]|uniref:Uncharacterized protein n=1 Tax=Rubus argutus TaxID=59490 RepID=A0AAW1YEE9_RUBAR